MTNLTSYQHEVIVPNKGMPFKLFLFEGGNGKYIREKHWHRSIELFAVKSGALDFYLNEQKYHLTEGEFVLVNSNELHSVHAAQPNETIVLQIPFNVFQNYFTKEQFIWFSNSEKTADSQVFALLKEMYEQLCDKRLGYELLMQSYFYQLEYLLVTKYRKLEVMEELLKKNKQLKRLGRITARINYKDYLQSVRLEHAVKELEQTDHQIGEIALKQGFPNSKAFSTLFREKYGILPNEYRKKIRK